MFPTKKKKSLSVIRDVSTRSTNWKQKNFFQPSRWHTVMLKQRGRMFAYIINQNGIFCSLIVDELSSIPTHTQRHRHCSQCCSRQSGKRRLSVSLWLTFRSATGTLATWGLVLCQSQVEGWGGGDKWGCASAAGRASTSIKSRAKRGDGAQSGGESLHHLGSW